MSSALEKFVTVRLDGSNWLTWSQQMTAYLRSQGLWQMTAGSRPRPASLPSTATPEDITARDALQTDWDDKNDQALGIIALRMSFALQTAYMKPAAEDTWTALKTAFDVPSSAAMFADIKTAMAFKLSGTRDPLPEIMRLNEIFERLSGDDWVPDPSGR